MNLLKILLVDLFFTEVAVEKEEDIPDLNKIIVSDDNPKFN